MPEKTKTKCETCHKEIEIPVKECDPSGLTWHCRCFFCSVCGTLLTEKNVKIRGDKNKLFCDIHAVSQPGNQPTCKIYTLNTYIRVVF